MSSMLSFLLLQILSLASNVSREYEECSSHSSSIRDSCFAQSKRCNCSGAFKANSGVDSVARTSTGSPGLATGVLAGVKRWQSCSCHYEDEIGGSESSQAEKSETQDIDSLTWVPAWVCGDYWTTDCRTAMHCVYSVTLGNWNWAVVAV